MTNREIKFRGKSTFDGRWVFGLPRIRDGLEHGIIEESNGAGHDVEIETITQYTGLKDKNEKEIYEGDILKGKPYITEKVTRKGEVKFDKGVFRVSMQGVWRTLYGLVEQCEVIGNIYDNPELLVHKEK